MGDGVASSLIYRVAYQVQPWTVLAPGPAAGTGGVIRPPKVLWGSVPNCGLPVTWKHRNFCQWMYARFDFLCCIEVHVVWQLEFLLLQEQSFTSWFHVKRSWILALLPAFVPPLSPIACSRKPLLPKQIHMKLNLHSLAVWHSCLRNWCCGAGIQPTRYTIHTDICSRAKFCLSITLSCFVSVQTPRLKYHLLLVHPLPGDYFLGHLGHHFWDILSHSLLA